MLTGWYLVFVNLTVFVERESKVFSVVSSIFRLRIDSKELLGALSIAKLICSFSSNGVIKEEMRASIRLRIRCLPSVDEEDALLG